MNVIIIDVKRKRKLCWMCATSRRGVTRRRSGTRLRARCWFHEGITLFSGGPKTPHMQRAGSIAVGAAIEPFFSAAGRKD